MKQTSHEQQGRAIEIIRILRKATRAMEAPASSQIVSLYGKDPFLILISCILSLRAKDTVSFPVSRDLFTHGHTPQALLKIPLSTLEKIIYKTGFYRSKARAIHTICKTLIDSFGGKVPRTQKELLSIKGVGLKTANLVLAVAFDIPAFIVDTHVHRLANLWGLVHTKTAEQTEAQLSLIVPRRYWIEMSRLMVIWGQHRRGKAALLPV